MKTKMASYTLDKLRPLTKARRAKLKAVATRPDSEIDTSDIPEMVEEQWKNARRGHFYRPRKRQITAVVDADVLDWLKAQGKGYQSRINAILRREMLTSVKSGKDANKWGTGEGKVTMEKLCPSQQKRHGGQK